MDARFPLTFPDTFDGLFGHVIDSIDLDAGEARSHVDVRPHHKQPAGLVHGGVYATMAESLTSIATWHAVSGHGRSVQGLGNQASFLRPILEGTVHALARVRHRGRTTWVWDVEFTDDQQRLCALVRMTIAVRAD